jgi:hypothetical protein
VILAALITQGITICGLLWFILYRDKKHNDRVDQLLTWIKDTPTAVVRADNGISRKPLVPTYVEDDALDEREATYESEEAPAGSDTE